MRQQENISGKNYILIQRYTILVNTESPKAEDVITMNSVIRKATAFDITLSNPLDEAIVFEVIITGEG